MGRVTAYQAADGRLFTDRKAYLQHERDLVAGARMANLVKAKLSNVDPIIVTGVSDFYQANANALREILLSKDTSLDGTTDDDGAEDGASPKVASPECDAAAVVPVDAALETDPAI